MTRWTDEEVEILTKLYDEGMDIALISQLNLPHRSEDSCRNKLRRLGKYRRKTMWKQEEIEYVVDNIFEDYSTIAGNLPGKSGRVVKQKMRDLFHQRKDLGAAYLLFMLKEEKRAIPMSQLQRMYHYHIGELKVREWIQELDMLGYDIKTIDAMDTRFKLIRDIYEPDELKEPMGEIETPLALIGDTHISSRAFSYAAWSQFIHDVKQYGVKHVLIAGDVIQARGVFNTELEQVVDIAIQDQEQRAIDLLRMIPKDVTIWIIAGNHEEKIKGSIHVGHDPLKAIARQMPNVMYLGSIAKLRVNGNYDWIMMHGEGSITDNPSRKMEKTYRSLAIGGKPVDGLVIGHYHVLIEIDHPGGRIIVAPGTFQRDTLYTERKGIPVEIGWKIFLELSHEKRNVITRTPRVV